MVKIKFQKENRRWINLNYISRKIIIFFKNKLLSIKVSNIPDS